MNIFIPQTQYSQFKKKSLDLHVLTMSFSFISEPPSNGPISFAPLGGLGGAV